MNVLSVSAITTTSPEPSSSDNWAHVAVELGYHDQSHFIHDLRELFGAGPGQLVALGSDTR